MTSTTPLLSLHDAVVIMGGIAIGSLVGLALAAVVEKCVAWRMDLRMRRGMREANKQGWVK